MAIFMSPAGNPEVWPEKPGGYFTLEEWAVLHPAPEPPTPEELAAQARAAALTEAGPIIEARLMRAAVQTESFSTAEFAVFARAGLFEEWTAGQSYAAGTRLAYEGEVYEVLTDVLSQPHQAPGSEGLLAVYRPLSLDPESGDQAAGTEDDPIVFIHGMDVDSGLYYSFGGKVYLAKAEMKPCLWAPDTPGLWQWEAVNG